jgi:hypothetical protein
VALGFENTGDLCRRAHETCLASGRLRERCQETRAVSMELRLKLRDDRARGRRGPLGHLIQPALG